MNRTSFKLLLFSFALLSPLMVIWAIENFSVSSQAAQGENDPCGCDSILAGGLFDVIDTSNEEEARKALASFLFDVDYQKFMEAAQKAKGENAGGSVGYGPFSAGGQYGFNQSMNESQFNEKRKELLNKYSSDELRKTKSFLKSKVANKYVVEAWQFCKRDCSSNTYIRSWVETVDEKSLLFCMLYRGEGEPPTITGSTVTGGVAEDSELKPGQVLKPGKITNGRTCQFINRNKVNETVKIIIRIPGRDITNYALPLGPVPFSETAKSRPIDSLPDGLPDGKTDLGYAEKPQFYADVNKDGVRDFCRFMGGPPPEFRCAFGTKNKTFAGNITLKGVDFGYEWPTWPRWMEDVDGDGRADYCAYFDYKGEKRPVEQCYLAGEIEFSNRRTRVKDSGKGYRTY